MLVSEIATRVKRQFGDESGVQITDADIIRWINDAQREIVAENGLLQTFATTSIIASQQEYVRPPDILSLRSIHLDGRKLTALSPQEAEEYLGSNTTPTGSPTTFWIWANKIFLYPTPTTAGTDNLRIFYSRMPQAVDDLADTPEIGIEHHGHIVEYCLLQAYEMDENWTAVEQKKRQFDEGLKELKGREDWSSRDFYPSITSLPEDYGYTDMYWE